MAVGLPGSGLMSTVRPCFAVQSIAEVLALTLHDALFGYRQAVTPAGIPLYPIGPYGSWDQGSLSADTALSPSYIVERLCHG